MPGALPPAKRPAGVGNGIGCRQSGPPAETWSSYRRVRTTRRVVPSAGDTPPACARRGQRGVGGGVDGSRPPADGRPAPTWGRGGWMSPQAGRRPPIPPRDICRPGQRGRLPRQRPPDLPGRPGRAIIGPEASSRHLDNRRSWGQPSPHPRRRDRGGVQRSGRRRSPPLSRVRERGGERGGARASPFQGLGGEPLHLYVPLYLRGDPKGVQYEIDAAYHQRITNEFRRLWGYGRGKPNSAELQGILDQVYSKYPIPPNARRRP